MGLKTSSSKLKTKSQVNDEWAGLEKTSNPWQNPNSKLKLKDSLLKRKII